MKSIKSILILISVLLFFSCSKNDNQDNSLAEQYGFDSDLLDAAVEAGRADGGMKCLIVNKDGVNVVEEYFEDHPDSLYHVRSVTKSFMSAIFGIAVDQGYMNVDETIADYLSQDYVLKEGVGDITIENLLTMSAGFEWDEFITFSTYFEPWYYSDDLIQFSLDLDLIDVPGQLFRYNTSVSHLLSAIFTKATGRTLEDFGNEYLFAPLSMSNSIEWPADADNYTQGGFRLHLTPDGMIKLGLLYLNDGVYNGNRIISEEWVNTSHHAHIATGNNYLGRFYGYQWWIDSYRGEHFYFANGYRGQFIFVYPEQDLVVVTRSDNTLVPGRSANQQWVNSSNIIVDRVFGALDF